ncbi:hypothetical protein ASF25_17495 [Methylobacterium sp. Leaf100]|nr:hypothetical protein ASF25_17495 [Methylobacterium sp. Leaf100]
MGYFDGVVTRTRADGFVMAVAGTEALRSRLAARLEWHRCRAAGADDLRAHPRIIPSRTDVTVRTATGPRAGFLRDVSRTGASIGMSEPRPAIDQIVTVGKRHATVVRHSDDGIAVRFNLPIRPEDLTVDLVL